MTLDQRLRPAVDEMHKFASTLRVPVLEPDRRTLAPRQRKLAFALAAAVVLALVIGLTALLVPFGDDAAPFVEEVVPPTVPDATVSSPPEGTTPPTPTTVAAVPAEPVPSITWTRMELAATSEEAALDTIVVTEDGFLAGGFDGRDAAIWRSDDGSTWNRATILTSTGEVAEMTDDRFAEALGFASLGGTTVAVGFEGIGDPGPVAFEQITRWESSGAWLDVNPIAAVWVSDDHTNWTRIPHDESVFGQEDVVRMWAVAASDDQFIAVGDAVWRSADGFTWERTPSPGSALFSIIFDGTQFVAAGLNSSGLQGIYRSVDGAEWLEMPIEEAGQDWRPSPLLDVAEVGSAYVAVGGGLVGRIWRAADAGFELEMIHQASRSNWHYLAGVASDGNRVVAVGEHFNNGTVALVCTSTDAGQTWTIEERQDVFGLKYVEDEMGAMRDLIILDGRIITVGRIGFGSPAVWIGTISN